jgi:peptidyl-prolyl cis-trans isomerase B (cyclophilin B)
MPESRKNRTPVLAAAIIVLLIVVGFVVAQAIGSDEDPATVTSAQESKAPTPPPGECVEPPAPPEHPEQYAQPPDAALAENATWIATVRTNCGDIVIELYGDKAPQTVSSFVFLARQGFWDNSPCHRLTTQGIYVLQCGDPTGTGTGGPGYTYELENPPADQTYPRGTLAMARTMDPSSNGSQFFIVYDESMLPDPGYSVFGRVVDGMDVIDRVAEAGVKSGGSRPGDGAPAQPVSILDITLEKST